jgi:aryl-alcohol dehydrogenase-like predicted oxidoreductase
MSLLTRSFFNLVISFCRRADTDVLSLMPLKRVVLSAQAAPSDPHSQPPYAEPLPMQVEEGLAVAVEVVEIAAPPPPVAATVMGEERMARRRPLPK